MASGYMRVHCLKIYKILLGYFQFLAHLNLSDHLSAVCSSVHPSICLSVCLSVCPSVNFSHFIFFWRTTGPISTKHDTKHPQVKGIQVCTNEGPGLFPWGDNCKIVKFLKIFFLRSIATELGTKQPWVKGIQVCSNEGPFLSPSGNNCEIVHIDDFHFISFIALTRINILMKRKQEKLC